MVQLKQRRFVKKAGFQVPQVVLRHMRRMHPSVEILWSPQAKKYCMVQTVCGVSQMICSIKGTPNLANTVYYLNSIHPSRFASKYARERLLASMDESEQAARVARRAKDQIRDGSSELFNQLTGRKVFQRNMR